MLNTFAMSDIFSNFAYMKIDITLRVTPKMVTDAQNNLKKAFTGHLGTHFDVMNKVFPLEYTELEGIVFDIQSKGLEEVTTNDVNLNLVEEGMFVAFHSGFIESEGYGGARYFREHPAISMDLIRALLDKRVALIGIDFSGLRLGAEHTPTDQLCADHGTFVIENLCNLALVLGGAQYAKAHFHTYPMKFEGMTGLPCRVVAEI